MPRRNRSHNDAVDLPRRARRRPGRLRVAVRLSSLATLRSPAHLSVISPHKIKEEGSALTEVDHPSHPRQRRIAALGDWPSDGQTSIEVRAERRYYCPRRAFPNTAARPGYHHIPTQKNKSMEIISGSEYWGGISRPKKQPIPES